MPDISTLRLMGLVHDTPAYETCPACIEYAVRRLPAILPDMATEAERTGETARQIIDRYMTRWQRFQLHVGHGLVMRYPLRHVLGFAVRHLFSGMAVSHPSDIDARREAAS